MQKDGKEILIDYLNDRLYSCQEWLGSREHTLGNAERDLRYLEDEKRAREWYEASVKACQPPTPKQKKLEDEINSVWLPSGIEHVRKQLKANIRLQNEYDIPPTFEEWLSELKTRQYNLLDATREIIQETLREIQYLEMAIKMASVE